jgi:NAD(P)-dependent dehydrogenase (short-subunit alcohol dehydrogenase family)
MRLKDKRIVVTGGSKGLGRALTLRFVSEGAYVAICARSAEELNRLSIELSSRGAHVLSLPCDIADQEQVAQFAGSALDELGSVDVLVNNASILGPRIELMELSRPTWDRVIDVNLNGLFNVTKAFLPSMLRSRSGSIINVTSSVGKVGRARWGAYGVSKFAAEGFTQTLADEVKNSGIRVNSVNPGPIDTTMRRAAYPDEDRSRLKAPEEVTEVFVYLAADESRGITGQYFEAQKFERKP